MFNKIKKLNKPPRFLLVFRGKIGQLRKMQRALRRSTSYKYLYVVNALNTDTCCKCKTIHKDFWVENEMSLLTRIVTMFKRFSFKIFLAIPTVGLKKITSNLINFDKKTIFYIFNITCPNITPGNFNLSKDIPPKCRESCQTDNSCCELKKFFKCNFSSKKSSLC